MKIIYCDSLVIGGGLAGLRAAVACQSKGLNTIVLSLIPVKEAILQPHKVVCKQVLVTPK